MTDECTSEKPKIENLELNRETVQDLTEEQAGAVKGGLGTETNDTNRPAYAPKTVQICCL